MRSASRVATERADAFVAMLRGCGRFLVDAAGMSDRQALTNRRDAIATSLVMIGAGAPAGAFEGRDAAMLAPAIVHRRAAPPTAAATPPPVPLEAAGALDRDVVDIGSLAPDAHPDDSAIVDIAMLAPDDADMVDIASLAPDQPDDIVDIASLAPDPVPVIPTEAPGTPSRLELAFTRQRALQRMTHDRSSSIDGLIGAEIVAIASLCYRGPAALARAEELQGMLHQLLRGEPVTLEQLRPLLDELLDLVPLVRDAA